MKIKRKPGRPKVADPIEFKSISVPKAVWIALFNQSRKLGTSVGKLATQYIHNGWPTDHKSGPNEGDQDATEVDF